MHDFIIFLVFYFPWNHQMLLTHTFFILISSTCIIWAIMQLEGMMCSSFLYSLVWSQSTTTTATTTSSHLLVDSIDEWHHDLINACYQYHLKLMISSCEVNLLFFVLAVGLFDSSITTFGNRALPSPGHAAADKYCVIVRYSSLPMHPFLLFCYCFLNFCSNILLSCHHVVETMVSVIVCISFFKCDKSCMFHVCKKIEWWIYYYLQLP